jgi:DNA polymerase-3 subunit epsilon
MIILPFDVETTGMILWDQPSDHPDQPRITQIACELVNDETREVLAGMHCIIKPDGWTIPEKLQQLTGITMERAERFGVPIGDAMGLFTRYWSACEMRVAHNENFDMRMIRIELIKMWRALGQTGEDQTAEKWKAGKSFCTQRESSPILKLPPTEKMIRAGFAKHKPPKLGEAYRHFTGKPLENAHNAMVDVAACKAVYFGIRQLRGFE